MNKHKSRADNTYTQQNKLGWAQEGAGGGGIISLAGG